MAGARIPITFRIFKGDTFLREETLTQAVIKVGKVPSSHLRLDDESVSRMHSVIEVGSASEVSIIDLGSTRGTMVNGQKVNKATLQSGDVLQIGDLRIEVAIGAAEEEDAPTKVQVAAVEAASPGPARAPAFAPAAAPLGAAAAIAPPGLRPAAPVFAASARPALNPMSDQVEDTARPHVIEVAAMLGDSVVSVKHCRNPRGGKLQAVTIGMLGFGVAAILVFLVTFAMAKGQASQNAADLKSWTAPNPPGGEKDMMRGHPAWSFRPVMLGAGYDYAAIGGLVAGLVCLSLGLVRARRERISPFYRIGRAAGVEFSTDDLPVDSFPLVAPSGDEFVFNFSRGMDGEMTVDGQATSLSELAAQGRARASNAAPDSFEVNVPNSARFRVRAGKATFLVSSVVAPRQQPVPFWAAIEARVIAFFGATVLAFAGILMLAFMVSGSSDTADADGFAVEITDLNGETESKEDPPPVEPEEEEEEEEEEESGGTGTAMALDEGKMGKKDSTRETGQFKMKNNNLPPGTAREQAMEKARTAGIAGSAALSSTLFASLTGTNDISSGFDDVDIEGGLLGDEPGEMQGGFGFGRSGTGPGGGGTGWGTVGTGRYGTIGHGSGTGSGYGVGGGRGGMRSRQASVPQVRIGQPSAVGDLDKAIIRRYIKRNLAKISYCYEKELLAKPGLQGTVATQFFISPNGTVASANASGVDENVAKCVADVLKSIEFPKPKGGGGVQVNYPFTFRPGGG